MKNLSVSIDDDLYEAAKAEAARRKKTVSALVRELLAEFNARSARSNAKRIAALDKKHAEGYEKYPVEPDEFYTPNEHLVWGEYEEAN